MAFAGATIAGTATASQAAATATAATLLATGVNVLATQQAAKSQSAIAKYNAKVKEQQAKAREQAGKVVATERIKRNRRLVEAQRAAFAAGGVTPEGTPVLVELAQVERGTLDALMEGHNAAIGAQQSRSQAELFRAQGSAAVRAGQLGVGQELFSGAVQLSTASTNRKLVKQGAA